MRAPCLHAHSLPRQQANKPAVLFAHPSCTPLPQCLCRSCAVCINTVGPFRLFGEPVVKACCEAGTHYLDICGEPGKG